MSDVGGRLDHLAEERDRAVRVGRDVTVPVGVTHFFGLADPPGPEPVAARAALHAAGAGEVVLDEEVSGDGHWHAAAFCTLLMEDPEVKAAEQQMISLAARHHLRYDGWTVTLTAAEERLATAETPTDN
ncbi:ribonuclease E inhibitor RraB [Spirillospora sp. CA-253888]